MIEVVPGSNRSTLIDLEPVALASFRELRRTISARSQIIWGEHCSECAYPHCYSTCSHYTPRTDFHCRRFEHGIESICVSSLTDTLMRIRFRKWGKLEGEGTGALRSWGSARLHEMGRSLAGTISDARLLPYHLRHGAGRAWTKLESAFASQRASIGNPDAFVVECISTGTTSVPFTLTILPKDHTKVSMFQEYFTIGPSYTRFVVQIERIMRQVDLQQPFLVQVEPLVEAPAESFLFGVVDFVKWKAAPARTVAPTSSPPTAMQQPAAQAKCIVWDLDDTLWDGTLAEVGVEGVKLRDHVLDVIRALDARGILHSIASKNNEAEALAALQRFGIDDLFLYPQISWMPKSQSIQRIAQFLDLGLNTFAFVDDQPFERSEVLETLGCVTAFPDTEVNALIEHPLFDVPVTAESPKRRLMYREEMSRSVTFLSTGGSDYQGFLRSCDLQLKLTLITPETSTRIYDLSQRTNQVNISGTRYDRRAVEQMAWDRGGNLPIVLQCKDRFGDYGIIGFALFQPDAGVVEDYFMSCRIQRKFVENAFFSHLVGIVRAHGGTSLRCRYRRTDRNKLALTLLSDLGFNLIETGPGVGWLKRGLDPIPGSDIVRLTVDFDDVLAQESTD